MSFINALASRVRGRPRGPVHIGSELNELQDHIAGRVPRPYRRGIVKAQGSTNRVVTIAGVGESVADGADYPIYTTYSSTVVGATGGPTVGDDVLLMRMPEGGEAVLHKVTYK